MKIRNCYIALVAIMIAVIAADCFAGQFPGQAGHGQQVVPHTLILQGLNGPCATTINPLTPGAESELEEDTES